MSKHSEIEKPPSTLDELGSLPSDFLNAAVKAAYVNPVKGATQFIDHLAGKKDESKTSADTHAAFLGLRWHAEQLGGAVGTMAPYFLCSKLSTYLGFGKAAAPFATGVLMEGVFRPVGAVEGDFATTRAINALTGALTFGTLGHLPGYLKAHDAKRFGVNQPWLVNSFTSDLKRHILSGAAAGTVDTESRSLLSGHGFNLSPQLLESVYTYGTLGGLMRSATEVVPHLTKGSSVNDIVQHSSYLNSRAKLDPVAKELIMDYGHLRVKGKDKKSAQDIYDLLAHVNVPEAIELKQYSREKGSLFGNKTSGQPISELLNMDLPIERFPFYSYHPIAAYREAFRHSSKQACGFLGVGFDSVVLKLEEGGAIKIGSQLRPDDFGKRFFDMPILEEGRFDLEPIAKAILENPSSKEWHKIQLKLLEEPNRAVNYVIQPEAMNRIPNGMRQRFRNHMPKIGYEFWDWQHDQLGYFDGRIVLLDYFAVKTEAQLAKERALKLEQEAKRLPTRLEEVLEKL